MPRQILIDKDSDIIIYQSVLTDRFLALGAINQAATAGAGLAMLNLIKPFLRRDVNLTREMMVGSSRYVDGFVDDFVENGKITQVRMAKLHEKFHEDPHPDAVVDRPLPDGEVLGDHLPSPLEPTRNSDVSEVACADTLGSGEPPILASETGNDALQTNHAVTVIDEKVMNGVRLSPGERHFISLFCDNFPDEGPILRTCSRCSSCEVCNNKQTTASADVVMIEEMEKNIS